FLYFNSHLFYASIWPYSGTTLIPEVRPITDDYLLIYLGSTLIKDNTSLLTLCGLVRHDGSSALSRITNLELIRLSAIFLFISTKSLPNSLPTNTKEGILKLVNFALKSAVLIAFLASINCRKSNILSLLVKYSFAW